jgi:hypothetical protein
MSISTVAGNRPVPIPDQVRRALVALMRSP